MKYRRFIDPGHSWTKVSLLEIDRLGLRNAISPYSYYFATSRGEAWAYLEEDQDLDLFFQAKQAVGEPVQYEDRHTNADSSIRRYQHFPSDPDWSEQAKSRFKLFKVARGEEVQL
jgi:hypothetical protein